MGASRMIFTSASLSTPRWPGGRAINSLLSVRRGSHSRRIANCQLNFLRVINDMLKTTGCIFQIFLTDSNPMFVFVLFHGLFQLLFRCCPLVPSVTLRIHSNLSVLGFHHITHLNRKAECQKPHCLVNRILGYLFRCIGGIVDPPHSNAK